MYRRSQAETGGKDLERLLNKDPPLLQEEWRRMRGWYRAAVDHALPPAQITLKRITAERMKLYHAITPPPPRDRTYQHL